MTETDLEQSKTEAADTSAAAQPVEVVTRVYNVEPRRNGLFAVIELCVAGASRTVGIATSADGAMFVAKQLQGAGPAA